MEQRNIIKYWFIFLIIVTISASTVSEIIQGKMVSEK